MPAMSTMSPRAMRALSVDDVHLLDVWGHRQNLGTGSVQGEHGDHAFVDLGAVVDAAAGQNYTDLRHGILLDSLFLIARRKL